MASGIVRRLENIFVRVRFYVYGLVWIIGTKALRWGERPLGNGYVTVLVSIPIVEVFFIFLQELFECGDGFVYLRCTVCLVIVRLNLDIWGTETGDCLRIQKGWWSLLITLNLSCLGFQILSIVVKRRCLICLMIIRQNLHVLFFRVYRSWILLLIDVIHLLIYWSVHKMINLWQLLWMSFGICMHKIRHVERWSLLHKISIALVFLIEYPDWLRLVYCLSTMLVWHLIILILKIKILITYLLNCLVAAIKLIIINLMTHFVVLGVLGVAALVW